MPLQICNRDTKIQSENQGTTDLCRDCKNVLLAAKWPAGYDVTAQCAMDRVWMMVLGFLLKAVSN